MWPTFWTFTQLVSTSGTGLQTVKENTPQLEDEVTVEVQGQPGSNKQQLYFLALAAANGMVKRRTTLTTTAGAFGMLMIEYNAAEEWVRCTLRYKWGLLATNVANSNVSMGTATTASRLPLNEMAVYRGPQCNVVGAGFQFTSSVLPGIPSETDPNVPDLPFKGSMILTACPTTIEPNPTPITQDPVPTPALKTNRTILSPNPKPPGDNRSRGAVVISQAEASAAAGGYSIQPGSPVSTSLTDNKKCCEKLMALIPMVMAALSEPATNSLMLFPKPVAGPAGS